MSHPTVLICYVHRDGGHNNRERVLNLCQRLRGDGVEAVIDQFYEDQPPPEGWPTWMQTQIQDRQFTLVVVGEALRRRWEKREEPGKGLGAVWEGSVILADLYANSMRNSRFIPVGFVPYGEHLDGTPSQLQVTNYYNVASEEDYKSLLHRLFERPRVVPAEIGLPPPLKQSTDAAPSPAIVARNSADWAMIGQVFCRSVAFSRDANGVITVRLKTSDSLEIEHLELLRNHVNRDPVPFAIHNDGWLCIVKAISSSTVGGDTEFSVTLEPRPSPNIGMEASTSYAGVQYTPTKIAELRARLILLGEEPPGKDDAISLVPTLVRGLDSPIHLSGAAISGLKTIFPDDLSFLQCARLQAILVLHITSTVERTRELILGPIAGDKVHVRFTGVRSKVYINTDPSVISVEGDCPL